MKKVLLMVMAALMTSGVAYAQDAKADKAAAKALKAEIKEAIETVFAEDGVKVAKVNTVRTIGKMKRQGRTQGMTPEVKKAYVILKKDSKPIKFFEGMAQ